MKELPILFSAPMVRAILSGAKTQTRRIVTAPPSVKRLGRTAHFDRAFVDPGPSPAGNPGPYLKLPITGGDLAAANDEIVDRVYPRWFPGDRLWVKETWRPAIVLAHKNEAQLAFRADGGKEIARYRDGWKIPQAAARGWVSPLLMPRWASRITLEVKRVRLESLHDISDADCLAEGLNLDGIAPPYMRVFKALWNEINGDRPGCSWAFNPFVFVIEFERCT